MESMRVYKITLSEKSANKYIEHVAAYSVEEAISKLRDDNNFDSVYSAEIELEDVLV